MSPEIKNRLLNEMELYFGKDKKRIDHARKVLRFSEDILNENTGNGVDMQVVTAAALLHDIGIHACERKYGSTQGQLQEKEGPPIARHIMEKLNMEEKIIKEVCDIIASHHSPGEVNTLNFKVLYDADWLVNLKDEVDTSDKVKLKEIISKIFLTDKGRELAEKLYLS